MTFVSEEAFYTRQLRAGAPVLLNHGDMKTSGMCAGARNGHANGLRIAANW